MSPHSLTKGETTMETPIITVNFSDHRWLAIQRAVNNGDKLRVSKRPCRKYTVQGQMETGYLVWGRSHGGDYAGCLFGTKEEAEAYVAAALDPDTAGNCVIR